MKKFREAVAEFELAWDQCFEHFDRRHFEARVLRSWRSALIAWLRVDN